MSQDPLKTILPMLDSPRSAYLGFDDTIEWPEGVLSILEDTGILRREGLAQSVACDGCDERGVEDVEFVRDKNDILTGFVICRNRQDVGRVRIDHQRLMQWSVSRRTLAERTAGMLGLEGGFAELMPNRLWRIGVWQSDEVKADVLFACGLAWPDGEQVLPRARSRKRGQTALILAPARPSDDAAVDGSLGIVPLGEVLRLDGSGLSADPSSIRDAVLQGVTDAQLSREVFRASDDYRCVWRHGVQLKPLSKM